MQVRTCNTSLFKEALAMRKANGVTLGRRKGRLNKMNILQDNEEET